MRICVLGNSHVACLKQGWDHVGARYPDLKVTFFASRQEGLKALRRDGDSLTPGNAALAKDLAFTSGGLDRVELAAYDVFLVHALGLAAPPMDRRLSGAVQRQICKDALGRSLNRSLCGLIRSASASPICIGLNPQRGLVESGPSQRHRLFYGDTCAMLGGQIDLDNTRLIEQPAQTLADGWHSRSELSRGSTRLDVGDRISNAAHPVDETVHMNTEFGCLYMENFVASLVLRTAQPVTA